MRAHNVYKENRILKLTADGMTAREITEMTGYSRGSIRNYLHRVRQRHGFRCDCLSRFLKERTKGVTHD